jgi:hypothetical protein
VELGLETDAYSLLGGKVVEVDGAVWVEVVGAGSWYY